MDKEEIKEILDEELVNEADGDGSTYPNAIDDEIESFLEVESEKE